VRGLVGILSDITGTKWAHFSDGLVNPALFFFRLVDGIRFEHLTKDFAIDREQLKAAT
jgi:hypothetical protein